MRAIWGCDSKGLLTVMVKRCGVIKMPTIIQSMSKRENIGRSINSSGVFDELPPDIQQQLKSSAQKKQFSDRQLIQHRGEDPTSFYVIVSGQVKMGHYDENGEMHALMLFGPGDSFGEMSCLGRFPRVLDAEAVGETELLNISEKRFSDALLASPALCREVMRVLAVYLKEALDDLVVFRKLSAPKRVVRSLLALTNGKSSPVMLQIRHLELAELVGVSRVSIAKTLSLLAKEGYLECGYGHILIHDREALNTWMKL